MVVYQSRARPSPGSPRQRARIRVRYDELQGLVRHAGDVGGLDGEDASVVCVLEELVSIDVEEWWLGDEGEVSGRACGQRLALGYEWG